MTRYVDVWIDPSPYGVSIEIPEGMSKEEAIEYAKQKVWDTYDFAVSKNGEVYDYLEYDLDVDGEREE